MVDPLPDPAHQAMNDWIKQVLDSYTKITVGQIQTQFPEMPIGDIVGRLEDLQCNNKIYMIMKVENGVPITYFKKLVRSPNFPRRT
jgi:hypothetical protein